MNLSRHHKIGAYLFAAAMAAMLMATPAFASGDAGSSRYTFNADAFEFGPGNTGKWVEDERGSRYMLFDGSYAANTWVDTIDGSYCFDAEGYLCTNSLVERDGKRYYVKDDGEIMTSVELGVDGIAYVVDETGVATPASELSEYDAAARELAASMIGTIINDSMTEAEKITAIFNFVRYQYMGYSTTGPLEDAAYSAVYGLRRRNGNCFEYAAVSHYLLLAAGFDDIIVTKHDHGHFWNLILTSEGWKHYDTTPWDDFDAGNILLSSNQFIKDNYWVYFQFDEEAYPVAY